LIMNIVNFKNLAKNSLRKKALLIAEAGYEAIDIVKTVNQRIRLKNDKLSIMYISGVMLQHNTRKCSYVDLGNYKNVFIIGIGKGSALASSTLSKILGKRLTGGIALDVRKLKTQNSKLKTLVGTHPLPSQKNIIATRKIVKLAKNLKKDDLLIAFICGGGSALLCGSEKEMKYSRTVFKELTKAGANILELNTARKHLSEVKGGNLAKFAYPATVISLIVSDVLGNDLSMVASGPTVFDKTTKKDAEKILKNYKLRTANHVPTGHLPQGDKLQIIETPKDKKYFKNARNILFLSNREPILAMAEKARKLSLKPKIYSLKFKGEAKKALLPMAKKAKSGEIILAGGEITVTLKRQATRDKRQILGKGGRNMEAVLGTLVKLIQNSELRIQNCAFLSVASDGRDNTEAAGAIGDILTLKKSEKLKLNPQKFLGNHDSFRFFAKTGDLIFVKQKTFNVADLMIVLKK